MPTKRRRVGVRRHRHAADVPPAVMWWLENGRPLEGGNRDAWAVSNLHFDRAVVSGWTRLDLRELGYGDRIDALGAAGKCPPDGWRKPRLATV